MPAKSSTTSKKSAPKQKKKSTPKASTKAEPEAEPVPTPVEPVEPVPVAESVPTFPLQQTSSLEGIESEFISLTTRLLELRTLQMSITSDLKKLQKTVHKHVKDSSKKQKKKRNMDPNRVKREPSGFAKPSLISTELCGFLGKPEGTEMARTEVTKYLTQYIKEHNLQDEANRRKILPDIKLQSLLNVGKGDEVTYFNLQKYMKVHFPKPLSASS